MKVLITLEVTVDKEAIEAEYGEKMTAADIRGWLKGEAVSATESALGQIDAKVEAR